MQTPRRRNSRRSSSPSTSYREADMALQSLDITARSATTTPSPGVRETQKVAKLIDMSKCIGCKACHVACMELNDLLDEICANIGVCCNPIAIEEMSWPYMRFVVV